VKLLSTIVSFLVCSGLGRILFNRGPLHILSPIVWSLEDIGGAESFVVVG
jgi:hypothetical protein